LIVVRTTQCCVKIVKYFHANDDVNVEKEGKKMHKFDYNRYDFQKNGEDIFKLVPNLEFN
jgi:hypothetical protein